MDFLLEKLRHNMAELSVQGDDFTRRICQLYITFEEFLEQQKLAEMSGAYEDTRSLYSGSEQNTTLDSSYTVDKTMTNISHSELDGYLDAPDVSVYTAHSTNAAAEASTEQAPKEKVPARSAVLESSTRGHHKCRYKRGHRKSYNSSRSVAATKSARDCHETVDAEYSEVVKNLSTAGTREVLPSRSYSDGDKDSVVCYAGTNSVDSGYKSSCPTPELSESIGHDNKQTVADKQNYPRSRILMGTKVISRNSPYADKNLEQLLYLRQSILIAMQRYEQQKSKSSPSPSFRPRSLSASTSGYQYGRSKMRHQARPLISSYPSSRTQSPSYSRFFSTENMLDTSKRERFVVPQSYTPTSDDRYWHSSLASLRMQQERSSWRGSARRVTSLSSELLASPVSPQAGGVSEVAKCMLEIVDDLQSQYLFHGESPPGAARSAKTSSAAARLGVKCGVASRPSKQPTDYHVYEEIMYDLAANRLDSHKPPPLPRRPDSILFNTATSSKKFSLQGDARQNYFPKQKNILSPL
ncbi:uncharacterized protein LOC134528811 [Bacillus rossius redtenbacheri]|uniref:uncharacterized protein LOC134528811 n=1 Tax=Bacillus rossius redtenbacheri TaxID=93214 RepID=UPI002FDE52EF